MLSTLPLYVRTVRWVGATTLGHTAIIKDQNGVVKWESVAPGGSNVEAELMTGNKGSYWDGFAVTALDSGKLYITVA